MVIKKAKILLLFYEYYLAYWIGNFTMLVFHQACVKIQKTNTNQNLGWQAPHSEQPFFFYLTLLVLIFSLYFKIQNFTMFS